MAISRVYNATLNLSTAITTQVDIFEVLTASGRPIELHEIVLEQTSEIGDAQEEMLELILKRITGSPTTGSGGPAAPSVQPILPNSQAYTGTWKNGSTTKLTGGTSVNMMRRAWNVRMPFIWTPTPEGRIVIQGATYCVLELATTPADSITKIVGYVQFAELV